MPHVSKRKLDIKTDHLLNDALNSLFSHLTKQEAKRTLSTLLTDTERLMISKRIGAILLIKEKTSESQIAEALKLTRQTVDKYVLIIKAGDEETWNFILRKLEQWHDFSTLKESLKHAGLYALKKLSRGMAGKI